MAVQNMLALLSILLLSVFTAAAPLTCGNAVRVISVRGTFEVLGESVLRDVFSAILGSGANAVLEGTPYPAVMDVNNPVGDFAEYQGSVEQGVQSLQGIIQNVANTCPNQKIVLIGYSQGANVIADALCGPRVATSPALASNYGDHIAAVVMFGDPTHVGSQSFTQGGATSSGEQARMSNIECAPYTDRMVSFCHPNDPICASGNDISEHLDYMPELDFAAAAFVMSKV
jgi:hypothetical protein